MTSSLVVPIGVQRPRVRSVPEYSSSAGAEAVELAASTGLILDPWQRFVLEDSLGERPDGRWSAFEVALMVPRQNGKGAILEARELAGLFLFGEQLILHSAHEFKTAAEAFRRVLALVENSDALRRKVKKIRTSHGDEGIELLTGARLRFVARSTGSGRGFSGDLVIMDEAYNLSADAMSALLPTLSARPNPQLWYTSSAGMESSEQLTLVRGRGRSGGDRRLAYFEFSAEPDADLDDREAWALANPALGIRISEEFIDLERGALDDAGFARERLGIWSDATRLTVIPMDQWNALADQWSCRVGDVAFAIDVTPDHAWSAITACGARADGLPHVELIEHRAGTEWVAGRAKELKAKHSPLGFWLDPSGPAGGLLPRLEQAGIAERPSGVKGGGFLEPVSGREHAQACAFLFEQTGEKGYRHLGQPELTAALDGATKRPLGDAWAWSRLNSSVNIAPLVAATLALWGFNSRRNERPASGLVDPNEVHGPDLPWDDDWD